MFCAMLSAFVPGMGRMFSASGAPSRRGDVGYVTVFDTYGGVDVTTLQEKENVPRP